MGKRRDAPFFELVTVRIKTSMDRKKAETNRELQIQSHSKSKDRKAEMLCIYIWPVTF